MKYYKTINKGITKYVRSIDSNFINKFHKKVVVVKAGTKKVMTRTRKLIDKNVFNILLNDVKQKQIISIRSLEYMKKIVEKNSREAYEVTKEDFDTQYFNFFVLYHKDTHKIYQMIKTKKDKSQIIKDYSYKDFYIVKEITRDDYYAKANNFTEREIYTVDKVLNQKEIDAINEINELREALKLELKAVPEPKIQSTKHSKVISRKTIEDMGL